jgi:hypothetical protein
MDKQIIRRNHSTITRARLGGEAGQTPTEYLMIVGIMAAVILIAFVVFFWDDVQEAAKNWSGNAKAAIDSGSNATGNTVTPTGPAKK